MRLEVSDLQRARQAVLCNVALCQSPSAVPGMTQERLFELFEESTADPDLKVLVWLVAANDRELASTFPPHIAAAIDAILPCDNEDTEERVARIADNPLAMRLGLFMTRTTVEARQRWLER